jgi:hypothetical protein
MKGMCDFRPGKARSQTDLCDYHRDGGDLQGKCPEMCDFPSCTNHAPVAIQYGSEDKMFCSFCAQAGLAIMLLSAQ